MDNKSVFVVQEAFEVDQEYGIIFSYKNQLFQENHDLNWCSAKKKQQTSKKSSMISFEEHAGLIYEIFLWH